MLVLLLAMEGPVLRPASPPVEYSPGLSAICAVLWLLLPVQLLQQLLLQHLLQLLSLSKLKCKIWYELKYIGFLKLVMVYFDLSAEVKNR